MATLCIYVYVIVFQNQVLFNRLALQRFINRQKMHIMDILEHGKCSV